jgi:putative FmdB family regulatory protein
MPIYEYACENCYYKFEELRQMDDDPKKCPGCGSNKIKRLISIPSDARSTGFNSNRKTPSATQSKTEQSASSIKTTDPNTTAKDSPVKTSSKESLKNISPREW